MNDPNRLLAACVLAASSLTVGSAAAAPTKSECISAINKGEDLRQAGKLLAARERFAVCVATSCPSSLREDCGKRLAEVVQATPTIVFGAKDGVGNDLSSVHVTMDGEPLTDRLDGTAMPMDPGEHRFTFETEGLPKIDKTIVVREADKDRHVQVALGASRPAPEPTEPGSPGMPTAAWVAFGAGGAFLAAGAILAGLAVHANSECSSANTCPPGVDARAQSDLVNGETIAAAVGFGAALVGIGVGVGVVLLAPAKSPSGIASVRVTPQLGLGWVGLEGRFQ